MLFRGFFRLLKLECYMFFSALFSSFNYFQISQNRNQTQAKTLAVMMTLFQRNCFVPMASLNQQIVIQTCRRTASRFQCYLLMYFKVNDKKKTSCFILIFMACRIDILEISYFFC